MTFNTSAQKISTKPNKNTFQIQTGESEDVSFEGALRMAYLHPSMTVAEIGGSPALKMLAQRVRQVHAIIASPSQLSTARGSLAEFNNITFHHGDAFSLPLNDGSVDALFAIGEPQLDPDPPAAIREMARLLRPGGRLVMNFGGAQEQTALRAWLSQAGLVNVIVADNTETGTLTAVGAKKVAARQGVRAAYAARALVRLRLWRIRLLQPLR